MFFFLPAVGPTSMLELIKVAIMGAGLAVIILFSFLFFIAALTFIAAGIVEICRWVFNIT
jgi:hypothetical protein